CSHTGLASHSWVARRARGPARTVDQEVGDRSEDREDDDDEQPSSELAARHRMPPPDDVNERGNPHHRDQNEEKPPEPRHLPFPSVADAAGTTVRLGSLARVVPSG